MRSTGTQRSENNTAGREHSEVPLLSLKPVSASQMLLRIQLLEGWKMYIPIATLTLTTLVVLISSRDVKFEKHSTEVGGGGGGGGPISEK